MTERLARIALAAVLLPSVAGLARADHSQCSERWSEPVVCEVDLTAVRPGEARGFSPHSRLELEPGEELNLFAQARDQDGRRFPPDRMALAADTSRDCRDLVEVRVVAPDSIRLSAGQQRGRCELTVYTPGNLNFEWRFQVEVDERRRAPAPTSAATVTQPSRSATFIADCLYMGILGRKGDAEGVTLAALEIDRGRVEPQIDAMFASAEYRALAGTKDQATLLDQYYRGILGRPLDDAGRRTYVPELTKGKRREVLLKLMTSPEFKVRELAAR